LEESSLYAARPAQAGLLLLAEAGVYWLTGLPLSKDKAKG
jgi:hypothetical protein